MYVIAELERPRYAAWQVKVQRRKASSVFADVVRLAYHTGGWAKLTFTRKYYCISSLVVRAIQSLQIIASAHQVYLCISLSLASVLSRA